MTQAHFKISLLTILSCLVCLTLAQQPAPTPAPVGVCDVTATKPNPLTQSYIFESCIVAKFAAYLTVTHNGTIKYVDLENGVVSNTSNCENVKNTDVNPKLIVNFGDCGQLELEISKNNVSEIFVKSINGFYKIGQETVQFSNSTIMFKTTEVGRFYKCNAEQTIALSKPEVDLVLTNFAYEAYREASGSDFYKIAEECTLDSSQVSDLVRIGVGVCLVALVAIVLIAYFVGRRRWSERSSYESV